MKPTFSFQNCFGVVAICCLALAACHKNDTSRDFKVSDYPKAGKAISFSLTFVAKTEYWDFGDGTTVYSNNTLTNHVDHVYSNSGSYTVKVTADNKYTVSKTITVQPNYEILYSGSPVPGDSLHFYFPAFLPVGNSYSWTFGDGGISGDSTPAHVYNATGDYSVNFYVNSIPTSSLKVLHIYKDPVYTSGIAGVRNYRGISWVSIKTGDTTVLPDKSITIKYLNKVALSVDYTTYTFNEQFSNDNELYYTTNDNSRDLNRIYYNRSRDSISINTTSLYSASGGSADVIYRFYHTP